MIETINVYESSLNERHAHIFKWEYVITAQNIHISDGGDWSTHVVIVTNMIDHTDAVTLHDVGESYSAHSIRRTRIKRVKFDEYLAYARI